MKKIFYFLVLFVFSTLAQASLSQTTLIYKAKGGSKVDFFQIFTIEKLADGYLIKIKFTDKGELDREHEVIVGANFETTKWKFRSLKTGLTIDAYKKDDSIFLTGLKNGKKTEKVFDLKKKMWIELFPTGLENFSLSSDKKIEFWSIGIEGPGEMNIGEFVAKRKGSESFVLTDSKKVEAELVTLTFNDWKSVLWSGKSWHRKSDGRVLAIEVGREIGTWELVSEK